MLIVYVSWWAPRWKIHEASMLCLGSVRQLIIDSVQDNKLQFDIDGYLQNVVLNDLNQNGEREGKNSGSKAKCIKFTVLQRSSVTGLWR